MRKLKFHEKKLLKKVDFMSWEVDNNLHEVRVMKKYYIQKREDYHKLIERWGARKALEKGSIDKMQEQYFNFNSVTSYGYNKLSRHVRELAKKIRDLDPKDPFRTEATAQLLEKLHRIGLIPTKRSLELADKVSATSFCRRRLPVVMVRSHMSETLKAAVTYIEQGHVRVGPETVTDPAFLVTRNMEDFVTWTHTSAIRKHVMEYNEARDDYDVAN